MTPLPVAPRSALAPPAWQPPVPPMSPTCTAPGCRRTAAHRHHAVSRSLQRALFGKVYEWVEINGDLVLILVDLCPACHDLLESQWGGCKARLRWVSGWIWYDRPTQEFVDSEKAAIWWFDTKTQTPWKLRGYVRGEYTLEQRTDADS